MLMKNHLISPSNLLHTAISGTWRGEGGVGGWSAWWQPRIHYKLNKHQGPAIGCTCYTPPPEPGGRCKKPMLSSLPSIPSGNFVRVAVRS